MLIAAALAAVLVGTRTNPNKLAGPVDTKNLKVYQSAPAFEAKGWINSPPLTRADLQGKVVLYDFWTYSCINCQRTFPYIRSWFDRYRADGLVVIGVHSPEFDFEKVHKNVEDAVKRDDVTWPVALDDNMTIWNQFQNQYWPADYITDRQGRIRYKHFGEGDYTDSENVIRRLLGVPPTSARAGQATHVEHPSAVHNPETYLGLQYQNPVQPLIELRAGAYDYPTPPARSIVAPQFGPHGEVGLVPGTTSAALVGKWTVDAEKATSDDAAATILIAVHAKEVNLVMAASKSGGPIDALVQLDGQTVPVADRGSNVHVDANGRTVVTIRASDMYRLVSSPTVEDHLLSVSATAAGLEAYDFTFG